MRITITGASGTGKSTLAELLSDRLQLPLIPELARVICQEKGFSRIGEIPDQEQFKLEVLLRQIEAERKLEAFIADRSVLDCWILWQRWNICSAMTYDTEKIYDLTRAHVPGYTHVVYIPPLIQPVEDGFRWTDPDYTKQVDRIVRMTLYELGLVDRTLTVTTDNVEDRIHEVLSWLDINRMRMKEA